MIGEYHTKLKEKEAARLNFPSGMYRRLDQFGFRKKWNDNWKRHLAEVVWSRMIAPILESTKLNSLSIEFDLDLTKHPSYASRSTTSSSILSQGSRSVPITAGAAVTRNPQHYQVPVRSQYSRTYFQWLVRRMAQDMHLNNPFEPNAAYALQTSIEHETAAAMDPRAPQMNSSFVNHEDFI